MLLLHNMILDRDLQRDTEAAVYNYYWNVDAVVLKCDNTNHQI